MCHGPEYQGGKGISDLPGPAPQAGQAEPCATLGHSIPCRLDAPFGVASRNAGLGKGGREAIWGTARAWGSGSVSSYTGTQSPAGRPREVGEGETGVLRGDSPRDGAQRC